MGIYQVNRRLRLAKLFQQNFISYLGHEMKKVRDINFRVT